MPELAMIVPEVCAYGAKRGYRLTPTQLYALYEKNKGPEAYKVGKRIYYSRRSVDEWIDSQIAATTRGGVR